MVSKRILQNVFILILCVICIYQVQELALESAEEYERSYFRPPVSPVDFELSEFGKMNLTASNERLRYEFKGLSIGDSKSANHNDVTSVDIEIKKPLEGVQKKLEPINIWVTMALCWSENTQYHGKGQFPYKEALPLSSQLWLNLTTARVIAQIVYTEPSISDELRSYQSQLESHGVLVKLVPAQTMDCVLKAQLIRILVFDLPEVRLSVTYIKWKGNSYWNEEIECCYFPWPTMSLKLGLHETKWSRISSRLFSLPGLAWRCRADCWRRRFHHDSKDGVAH